MEDTVQLHSDLKIINSLASVSFEWNWVIEILKTIIATVGWGVSF